MSPETFLELLRHPGKDRCFFAFGIRIELVDGQEGIRFVSAREELGLPPEKFSPPNGGKCLFGPNCPGCVNCS